MDAGRDDVSLVRRLKTARGMVWGWLRAQVGQLGLATPRAMGPRAMRFFLAATAAVALLWFVADGWYTNRLIADQRALAASDLSHNTHLFQEETSERLAVLAGLEAFATMLAVDPEDHFELSVRTATAVAEAQGITWFAIAPLGRVALVYPPGADDIAVGDDLLAGEPARFLKDVERAIGAKQTTSTLLEGSVPGGAAVVIWRPVYDGTTFWGLLGMRWNLDQMFGKIETHEVSHRLEIAARDGEGRLLFGPAGVFANSPVLDSVYLPQSAWEVGAVPEGGWEAAIARPQTESRFFAGLLTGLLLFLTYLVLSRQTTLANTVAERTEEIRRINDELVRDVARRRMVEAEYGTLLEQMGQRVAERTHHLAALYDVAAVAGASLNLDEVLERSLDRILAVTGCDVGAIHLHQDKHSGTGVKTVVRGSDGAGEIAPCPLADSDDPSCWILRHNAALVVEDTASDPRTAYAYSKIGRRAHAGVPIRGRQGPLGVLCVFRDEARPFTDEEAELLAAISENLGVAVENARLFSEARDKAALEERQRLARELHDSVTQLLYSSVLMAEAARRSGLKSPERMLDYLTRLNATAQQALKEMRLLVYELRPLGAEQDGLIGILQRRLDAVEKRAGLRASLVIHDVPDLPAVMADSLYRVAQEALNNALKHANGDSVTVEIGRLGDAVVLRVADNGAGFDSLHPRDGAGMGLTTMRERVEGLGGSLKISSAPGEGTVVEATVPLATTQWNNPETTGAAGSYGNRSEVRM